MERWIHKVIALFSIFFIIFVSTALPIKVSGIFASKGKKGKTILSCMACFGGGIFLGAYLLHMAPEVRETLEESLLTPNNIHYPLPELITAGGFFLVMLTEKIIMDWGSSKLKTAKEVPANQTDLGTADIQERGDIVEKNGVLENNGPTHGAVSNSSTDYTANEVKSEVQSEPIHPENDRTLVARSLILLSALSLECVFEGLSLGLKSSVTEVWNLFVAIISHEIVIAFSLGLELVKYNTPKRTLFAAFIYGITVPVGITIGTVIKEATNSDTLNIDLISGILQAIASGIFIYVTFFDILMSEVETHPPWSKVLPIILGVTVMAGLAGIPEGEAEDGKMLNATVSLAY